MRKEAGKERLFPTGRGSRRLELTMSKVFILGLEKTSHANNNVVGHHVEMASEMVLSSEIVE
jgi:hypothetical protein